MNNYTLITGASSGIGEQFAWVFAEQGHNLILVSRGKDKLNQIASNISNKHKVQIKVFNTDLSVEKNCINLFEYTQKEKLNVNVLVNNAGFGNYGYFNETDLNKEINMINLNITALVILTKLYLKGMVKNDDGKILNVASVAAFFPGPLMSIYYASKAFVLSFSEAISAELEDNNINVSVLCPGPVKTGFQQAANIGNAKFLKFPTPSAREVAEYGYKSLYEGKIVAVHGTVNKIQTEIPRFLPRKTVANIVKKVSDSSI